MVKNHEKKAKRRAEVFSLDCEKAFEMGEGLVGIDVNALSQTGSDIKELQP